MKKSVLMAAICASLTLFAACSGSNKQGTTDSSAVTQDSAGVDTGNVSVPSQSGSPAGDTGANKQEPVASPGGTPQ